MINRSSQVAPLAIRTAGIIGGGLALAAVAKSAGFVAESDIGPSPTQAGVLAWVLGGVAGWMVAKKISPWPKTEAQQAGDAASAASRAISNMLSF